MVNFGMAEAANNRTANTIIRVRGCIVCFAVLGIIGPLVLLGTNTEKSWEDYTKWFDVGLGLARPYVCQTAAPCAPGWRLSTDATKCLRAYAEPKTFPGAELDCVFHGAALASIKDARQNADVLQACGDLQPCLIGLKKDGAGNWNWVAGGSRAVYTNWEEGEPNNVNGEESVAVLGFKAWETEVRRAGVAGGIGMVVGVIINILCMCLICGFFYSGVTGKNGACVLCAACGDGCCCIIVGITVAAGLAALAMNAQAGRIVTIIFSIIQLGLLATATVMSLMLHSKLQAELNAAKARAQAPVAGAFQAVHVMGSPVVVGQPVMIQAS